MMKIVKNKWIVFMLLIVAFVILDTQIRHVTLAQRGIVLGVGIDKEGDEYVTTAEMLAPSNLGAESYQKNRLLSVERGATLRKCFERMEKALGVRVSLKHTVLIVMGEKVLREGDYTPLIDLFVGNEVADDTYIVAVSGDARTLFDANSPLYRTISYKIAETFRSPDIESGVVSTNVKDFFRMYLGESGSIYIPHVEVGKGNMSESNGEGESDADSLIFGRIAVLDKEGLRVLLDEGESAGLSYVYGKVNEANLYVEDGKDSFDMDIIETRCDRSYDIEGRSLTLKITMWGKIGGEKVESNEPSKRAFSEQKKKLAGEMVQREVLSAVSRCHREGVDILGISTQMKKRLGGEYEEYLGSEYLKDYEVRVVPNIIAK